MNAGSALPGVIIFLALIVGANLVMYGIARGLSKGDARWLQALTRNLGRPSGHNRAMDELHRRVESLSKKEETRKLE